MDAEFIACQQGFTGPQVMDLVKRQLNVLSLNSSGLHYFILDEVDNLTKAAQQSLKSAMNTTQAIFILTTNHISQLEKGFMERCVLVEMNAAQPSQLMPLARKLAADMSVALNDDDLLDVVKPCNGSFRNVIHNVHRRALRQSQLISKTVANDEPAAA